MTAIRSSAPADVAAAEQPGSAAPGGPVRLMGLGLWGVVGGLLAYGVLQTAIKAAALFG